MRNYTKIQAWQLADDITVAIYERTRLGYLTASEAATLEADGRQTFACLYGLIRAVEKDAGKLTRFAATITSLLIIGMVRLLPPPPISG